MVWAFMLSSCVYRYSCHSLPATFSIPHGMGKRANHCSANHEQTHCSKEADQADLGGQEGIFKPPWHDQPRCCHLINRFGACPLSTLRVAAGRVPHKVCDVVDQVMYSAFITID